MAYQSLSQQAHQLDKHPKRVLFALQSLDQGNGFNRFTRCCRLAHFLHQHYGYFSLFWVDAPRTPELIRMATIYGVELIRERWSLPEMLRQETFERLVLDFETPLTQSLTESIRSSQAQLPIIALDNTGVGCQDVNTVVLSNPYRALPFNTEEWSGALYRGLDYVVLSSDWLKDPAYLEVVTDADSQKPRLFVCFAPVDPDGMSLKVLQALKDIRNLHIDLVIPAHGVDHELIERMATQMQSTITLHWRYHQCRSLMQQSTLAITAYDLSVYELTYHGVPGLFYTAQTSKAAELAEFCTTGGHRAMGTTTQFLPEVLAETVQELMDHPERIMQMRHAGSQLISPGGDKRVAEIIVAASPMQAGQLTKMAWSENN